jgi:hypothetical protein
MLVGLSKYFMPDSALAFAHYRGAGIVSTSAGDDRSPTTLEKTLPMLYCTLYSTSHIQHVIYLYYTFATQALSRLIFVCLKYACTFF